MPRMARTTTSSISVKPFSLRVSDLRNHRNMIPFLLVQVVAKPLCISFKTSCVNCWTGSPTASPFSSSAPPCSSSSLVTTGLRYPPAIRIRPRLLRGGTGPARALCLECRRGPGCPVRGQPEPDAVGAGQRGQRTAHQDRDQLRATGERRRGPVRATGHGEPDLSPRTVERVVLLVVGPLQTLDLQQDVVPFSLVGLLPGREVPRDREGDQDAQNGQDHHQFDECKAPVPLPQLSRKCPEHTL